jgi:hypothetical protein
MNRDFYGLEVLVLPSHPLVQFKRGDHICLFYKDEGMLVQTLAAYLAAGLRNGERCFCAQKPHIIPRIYQAMELLGVDTKNEISRGALEIHTEDEVYFSDGRFEPHIMIEMLERSIEEAVAKGFTGFRTAGEMSWALEESRGNPAHFCDQLLDYEKLVQAAYPGKAAIGICQYPIDRFPQHTIAAVLDAHCVALEETMASTNHSTLTIRLGDYLADIVTDRLNPGGAYHYVVQGCGSREVLSWGVEPTIDSALASSGAVMADLSTKTYDRVRQ